MPARRRREGYDPDRLDPVRWRRPGGRSLLRLGTVAALLSTAAVVAWSRPDGCRAPAPPAGPAPSAATPSAAAPSAANPAAAPRVAAAPPTPADDAPGIPVDPGAARASRPTVPRGRVGVPVRLADPSALAVLRVGDRVDLLGVAPAAGTPSTIATDAAVLAVTGAEHTQPGGVLLALRPGEAHRAVGAPEGFRFAVTVRAPG